MSAFRLIAATMGMTLLAGGGVRAAEVQPAMSVLITNDDGIDAEGLKALVEAFKPIARVVVSAPAENNSGASQSVTALGRTLRVVERDGGDGVERYAVYGTPSDAAIFGLLGPGRETPFDLVVSGINKGQNVGEAAFISGTIGAARQAVMMAVPALAVSQAYRQDGKYDYRLAARFAADLAGKMQRAGRMAPVVISVNVPDAPKGVKLVETDGKAFDLKGVTPVGPNAAGGTDYRVVLDLAESGAPGTDAAELANGFITVSLIGTNANAAGPAANALPAEMLALPRPE